MSRRKNTEKTLRIGEVFNFDALITEAEARELADLERFAFGLRAMGRLLILDRDTMAKRIKDRDSFDAIAGVMQDFRTYLTQISELLNVTAARLALAELATDGPVPRRMTGRPRRHAKAARTLNGATTHA